MPVAIVSYIHHIFIRAEPAICKDITELELVIATNFQHIPKVCILCGFCLTLNFFGFHVRILNRLFYQLVGNRNRNITDMINEIQ